VRAYCRWLAIGVISGGTLLLPVQSSVQAATTQNGHRISVTIAVVGLSKLAYIGSADAISGTTIYSGDTLRTDAAGELGLAVGHGEVFLLSDSAAKMGNSGAVVQATLLRGRLASHP